MDALSGLHFRVAAVPSIRGTVKAPDGSWSGYAIEALRFAAQLANFSYEIVEPLDGVYGGVSFIDATSDVVEHTSGMIAMLQAGGGADVALGQLTNTPQRRRVVRFTHPFDYKRLAVFVSDDDFLAGTNGGDWLRAFRVYSLPVWISVLGVALLVFAVSMLMERSV